MTDKNEQLQGRILKALGGFYYVHTGDGLLECRARGVFRKREQTPYVGDFVTVEPTEAGKGYLMELAPRKNVLIRPPMANLDQLFLVVSTLQPAPNYMVLDKLLAVAEHKDIDASLVVTKIDRQQDPALVDIYRRAGYTVYCVSSQTGEGVDAVRGALAGKVSAFTGNTGVGKSSLLNAIDSRLGLATGATSEKLGRGRHTTRHVELFEVADGYVADTPGFSSIELERFAVILKEQLQYCYRDFAPYLQHCRFTGCSHTREKGCAVLQAVAEGKIAPSRHESYLALYEDAKKRNVWEYQDQ